MAFQRNFDKGITSLVLYPLTVTKNHFLSYVCIEPEIDPIAQQSVFKFLEDHALPFTWIEKIIVEK